jgi:DNA modification methylase
MKRIPDQFIDGIITSPPYNIATKRTDCYYDNGYSDIDNLSPEEYLKIRTEEFREFSRIIKNGAVICYNISYCKDNPILPTLLVSKIYNETDLTIADIICWKKNTSIPFQTSSTKLSRIAELIYIFVKKDYLHSFQTNKEISKTNEKTGQKFYRNYTNFIEAKNNDGYHCSLKASFSQELVDKIINIYFGCDSLIYDPFTGIGTTELSCIENSLNYIGSEISSEYFKIAEKRIKTSSDKKSQRLILQDLRLDEFF